MPSKDKYHDAVKTALEKEGWIITHDPLTIKVAKSEFYVDLGAEFLVAAEKDNRKIAIEIKSFINMSFISDFYGAIGQYITYENALNYIKSDRTLFLALPLRTYLTKISDKDFIKSVIQKQGVNLLVFNPENQSIVKWIK